MPSRSRPIYALLVAFVIVLGLASRIRVAPHFVHEYVGDALYALMIFLGLGGLFPKFSSLKIAALALGFCCLIEISQLYHAPWIDAIRNMRFGGLVLGFGFLWSDLVCYFVGVSFGFLAERLVFKT
jgi:Protein of unknown function (DUF2809)